MKKLNFTEEQLKKYPFAKELIEIFSKYSGEELLECLDDYCMGCIEYADDTICKALLLGDISLPEPNDYDDWTREEKIRLFDRWDIVNKLVIYSSIGKLKQVDSEDEVEEIDPTMNNGEGMVN